MIKSKFFQYENEILDDPTYTIFAEGIIHNNGRWKHSVAHYRKDSSRKIEKLTIRYKGVHLWVDRLVYRKHVYRDIPHWGVYIDHIDGKQENNNVDNLILKYNRIAEKFVNIPEIDLDKILDYPLSTDKKADLIKNNHLTRHQFELIRYDKDVLDLIEFSKLLKNI